MTPEQMRAVAREVTRAQRVVRPLPGRGYGYVGMTQTAVVGDLQPTSLRYVDELLEATEVTAQDRRVINLYSAVFAIEFLREQAEPDDRSERLLDKVDEWILAWDDRVAARVR